ncbi:MAG TPA: hypothetical protein VE959_18245 [Bryobacteraceae bacterium]|nr:hypothetical protein [Bryobacteraceae bacterium]
MAPRTAVFQFEDKAYEKQALALLRRLPPLDGDPLVISSVRGLRDRHGPVHAGAFLRARRIAFDCARPEFPRVFVHELFHFVWLRAGNVVRLAFEDLLRREWQAGARGELGWSAEWRKAALRSPEVPERSRRWREYCCESFCDTAAWLYSGATRHEEFTLERRCRLVRRDWFRKTVESRKLSI